MDKLLGAILAISKSRMKMSGMRLERNLLAVVVDVCGSRIIGDQLVCRMKAMFPLKMMPWTKDTPHHLTFVFPSGIAIKCNSDRGIITIHGDPNVKFLTSLTDRPISGRGCFSGPYVSGYMRAYVRTLESMGAKMLDITSCPREGPFVHVLRSRERYSYGTSVNYLYDDASAVIGSTFSNHVRMVRWMFVYTHPSGEYISGFRYIINSADETCIEGRTYLSKDVKLCEGPEPRYFRDHNHNPFQDDGHGGYNLYAW